MSENTSNKTRVLVAGSLALNIFLAAFILGRLSMSEMMPPPPPPPPPFAMDGDMPPPPPEGGHFPAMGKHMRHPPFFAPAELFTPDEMEEGFAQMRENFSKVRALREDFAKQLQQGSVTKEQALAHFNQVDEIMESAKKGMREKAAEKISTLTPEERTKFADRLLKKR